MTSTNVTIWIFLVLSKTAFGFKGVSGNRLRSSVEISDRFFYVHFVPYWFLQQRQVVRRTYHMPFWDIWTFFIIRPDVPKKILLTVVVFQAQILSFGIQLVKIVLAYVTRVVYYTMFSSHYINRAAAPQVLKKRKVTAKQRKLTFPFPIVSQTKVASLLQSWTLRAKWIGSKNRGLSRPVVRSLDMGY